MAKTKATPVQTLRNMDYTELVAHVNRGEELPAGAVQHLVNKMGECRKELGRAGSEEYEATEVAKQVGEKFELPLLDWDGGS